MEQSGNKHNTLHSLDTLEIKSGSTKLSFQSQNVLPVAYIIFNKFILIEKRFQENMEQSGNKQLDTLEMNSESTKPSFQIQNVLYECTSCSLYYFL